MSDKKLIIYQVFTRLFGNNNNHCINNGSITENGCGKMADFTAKALGEIKKLGATHIWYTGIIEHATQTDYRRYNIRPDHPAIVKGKAGSPYAIKDYYDVDPDLAKDVPERMREFENLVQRTHRSGLKVIIDFVPNHVARQYHSDMQPDGTSQLGANDDTDYAFSPYNNFYYIPQSELHGQFDMKGAAAEPYKEFPAKATGNNRFDAYPNINDWYETVKLNYGVDYQNGGTCHFNPIPDTWNKMLDILMFWAEKHIDGFRCDMAEMVPVEFWEWAIPQVKAKYPALLFIAEVYNPKEYGNYLFRGKFDYLYDKVGLYDTLRAIVCGNESATAITRAWQSLGGIEKRMLNFLENHDEQRIASDFFASNPRKAIPALIVSACMNVNPMMIYFGQEFGELGNYGVDYQNGGTCHFNPIPDTWNKMLDILMFWAEKHIDGFRCDMAEMVPVEFWEWAIPQVKAKYPALLFIAEVYNPKEYGNYLFRGKFDYLYDKVGLYDTLRAIVCGNESATAITRAWQSLGGIEKRMLNFLENHDEQRIASDFFASNPRKAIPALIVSACMNVNPMMIYFGQEFGELGMDSEGFSGRDGRTTIFDYWSVDTIRRWRNGGKFDGKMLTDNQKHLYGIYQRILTLCNEEKAISQGDFFDLMYANINGWRFNEHKQYTFLRKYGRDLLLFVVNFDHISADLAINIPSHAFDFLQIPQMEQYRAVDLLTGKEENISLLPYKATEISVEGYSGKILKIKL